MEPACFLAFDLGATSGRAILGTLSGGHMQLDEIHRFPNRILEQDGHLFWDMDALFAQIREGLRKAAALPCGISSIGIDTWGVDVAFFDADGRLQGQPFCYRDPHTAGAPQRFFTEKMDAGSLYARTGIQVMDFNTLFQLFTLRRSGAPQLAAAEHILFLPDALTCLLTGQMVTEATIASTSHFLDPVRKQPDPELLAMAGVSVSRFAPMVQPGTVTGRLKPEIARACGLPCVPVVSVAGHDTASAVAAVPASGPHFAYLSSGTWSLMGIETRKPILTPEAARANITNEGGVFGTTRFLKNITGMWIIENLLREWAEQGRPYSYQDLPVLAGAAAPFARFVFPDDPSFAHPDSMVTAIDAYCERTGQAKPDSHAAYVRLVFESLAMRYREVLQQIVRIAGQPADVLHIIGGGSKNRLLNQFTANATGRRVVAGPAEATAIGNVMMQAVAAGIVHDLDGLRSLVASSVETETFLPEDTAAWQKGYQKYSDIVSNDRQTD